MKQQAYAKINLTLDITGRDEKGYHLLSSLFARVSLSDTVTLVSGGKGIHLQCNLPFIPTDERNLCYKAVLSFSDELSIPPGNFYINIWKRIPVCAGLGGGSSDAAAVLQLLCRHYGISSEDPAVLRAALRIGADVPFFLKGGLCLAEGIGEKLTLLPPLTGYAVLIAKTSERASTPEVYREYDSRGELQCPTTPAFLQALREKRDISPYVSNHLTNAAVSLCPSVEGLKTQLRAAGALAAEMSGSGSAVYGLFPSVEAARNASKKIDAQFKKVCRFV